MAYYPRKASDQPLAQVIEELVETYHLKGKLTELRIIQAWQELMGKPVSNQTKDIYFSQGKLYLRFESSVLKQEMWFAREKMRELVNKKMNSSLVEEIVLL